MNVSIFFNKKFVLSQNIISIKQGEKLEEILKKNIININSFEIFLTKIYYMVINASKKKYIHYGQFYLDKNISLINIIKIISEPSNLLKKITIIEGSSKNDLKKELSKFFKNFKDIPYNDIIADTYYIDTNSNFDSFVKNLKKNKNDYFKRFKMNQIYKMFNEDEIMTIGSLIEKEGLDLDDKRKISSVIFNRINDKMKLQIDATVLYAITNGDYKLSRKLLLSDLKIKHPYNTYVIDGLPPTPISYVGRQTLDIIFENYKSEFLFYFFNNSLNRHIFSNNYQEHLQKLNEYRNNK